MDIGLDPLTIILAIVVAVIFFGIKGYRSGKWW